MSGIATDLIQRLQIRELSKFNEPGTSIDLRCEGGQQHSRHSLSLFRFFSRTHEERHMVPGVLRLLSFARQPFLSKRRDAAGFGSLSDWLCCTLDLLLIDGLSMF